ncbi:N-acetylmuramoyl-L-alanine amidase [Streptomyces sp. NPDC093225]|uniref:peptidoglycan recognition protein family protein n=1 Tax=Streptomyces sp. NPDC093225 TaxID=3366034 RepID=UPI0037F5BCE1
MSSHTSPMPNRPHPHAHPSPHPSPNPRRRTLLTGALALGALTAVGLPGTAGTARAAGAPGTAADEPQITDCDTWGARSPKSPIKVLATGPQKIIVHHTGTDNVTDYSQERSVALARAMQTHQMDTWGWIDTGQNFTISRGAYITEGRHGSLAGLRSGTQTVESAHCTGQNTIAVGIENEGTYLTEEPRGEQYEALVGLCAYICRQYGLRPYQIYGHRDFNSTLCPGDRLYALLPKLRADVAALVGGDPTAPVWPLLHNGDSGERVRVLQHLLVQRGASIAVDGAFGPGTEAAVTAFQKFVTATVDGWAGNQTWLQLCAPVSRGGAGAAVKAVQNRLTTLGFPADVDGLFGPGTEGQVKAFQTARGLPSDGVVDARTWSRLLA